MGKLNGKVAFITGAARGQGRSHAIRLASEGADIIAGDLCGQIASIPYPMSTTADLDQTVKEVQALGRRVYGTQLDVRDEAQTRDVVAAGIAEIGPIDIVLANAGDRRLDSHTVLGCVARRHRCESHWRLSHDRGDDPRDDRATGRRRNRHHRFDCSAQRRRRQQPRLTLVRSLQARGDGTYARLRQ
jgi:NAD(P)-dependent dehydrogenase (short-subunit alcohol dehydrogenase family)